MKMSNQQRTDRIVRRQRCWQQRISEFEIGFEGSVSVDKSKMGREGIPNRGASMPKTTRGESNVDTRLGDWRED